MWRKEVMVAAKEEGAPDETFVSTCDDADDIRADVEEEEAVAFVPSTSSSSLSDKLIPSC